MTATYTTPAHEPDWGCMASVVFVMIVGIGFVCASVVSIVYMGIQYSTRKRGLTTGASRRELEEIRGQLDTLGSDMHGMQEAIADLTLMLGDSPTRRLPRDDK